MPLLEFRDVDTHYGDLHVLKSVNYSIEAGEIVCLLGGNACGKSTTMKTIMGTVRATRGQVLLDGDPIGHLSTAERVRRGIAPVLEARRLFPRMSVKENLEMGAYVRKRGPEVARDLLVHHALVEGDWNTRHAFVTRNRERLEQVAEMERRARRELVVDDETLYAFFDAGRTWENGRGDINASLSSQGIGARTNITRHTQFDIEGVIRNTRLPSGTAGVAKPLKGEAVYWRVLTRF